MLLFFRKEGLAFPAGRRSVKVHGRWYQSVKAILFDSEPEQAKELQGGGHMIVAAVAAGIVPERTFVSLTIATASSCQVSETMLVTEEL